MIGFAEKVLAYTDGLNQEGFTCDSLIYDATLRNLELIGEAATTYPRRCASPIRMSPGDSLSRPATA
jgi:uncharacterized protein with HEPN domain